MIVQLNVNANDVQKDATNIRTTTIIIIIIIITRLIKAFFFFFWNGKNQRNNKQRWSQTEKWILRRIRWRHAKCRRLTSRLRWPTRPNQCRRSTQSRPLTYPGSPTTPRRTHRHRHTRHTTGETMKVHFKKRLNVKKQNVFSGKQKAKKKTKKNQKSKKKFFTWAASTLWASLRSRLFSRSRERSLSFLVRWGMVVLKLRKTQQNYVSDNKTRKFHSTETKNEKFWRKKFNKTRGTSTAQHDFHSIHSSTTQHTHQLTHTVQQTRRHTTQHGVPRRFTPLSHEKISKKKKRKTKKNVFHAIDAVHTQLRYVIARWAVSSEQCLHNKHTYGAHTRPHTCQATPLAREHEKMKIKKTANSRRATHSSTTITQHRQHTKSLHHTRYNIAVHNTNNSRTPTTTQQQQTRLKKTKKTKNKKKNAKRKNFPSDLYLSKTQHQYQNRSQHQTDNFSHTKTHSTVQNTNRRALKTPKKQNQKIKQKKFKRKIFVFQKLQKINQQHIICIYTARTREPLTLGAMSAAWKRRDKIAFGCGAFNCRTQKKFGQNQCHALRNANNAMKEKLQHW